MTWINLGRNAESSEPVSIPIEALNQHLHVVGGTGKGKTTALHTILHELMTAPGEDACFFIIDRMGSFSHDLLMWFASDFCPQYVRERLLYIRPAREDVVLGFNPLIYDTQGHGYFRVARATDIILRAWDSMNIEAMPRLARWVFNAFWAAAQLGLTISDCDHLLLPGSKFHKPLLSVLPQRLHAEWSELLNSRSGEVLRTLDSSRNRLKPYFESDVLRRMFGSTQNRLNVRRFMEQRRIVLLDLSQGDRLSLQLTDAIGSLVLNELLATARSLPPEVMHPTYVVLDEFQNFIGPDIEAAIPEVRQLGLKLILSHQSFSQLRRGDHDLTSLIFQCQSRLMFGLQGDDAGLLAAELASLTYDPKKIKDELYTRKQLIAGHEIRELVNRQNSQALSDQWNQTYGANWNSGRSSTSNLSDPYPTSFGHSGTHGGSIGSGTSGGATNTTSEGTSQTFLPVYDEFLELSRRTYYTFEEQHELWAQSLRLLQRGEAVLRLCDDPNIHRVSVRRSAPGHLSWSPRDVLEYLPHEVERCEQLVEENFQQPEFTSPELIDREIETRLLSVIRPRITLGSEEPELITHRESDQGPFDRQSATPARLPVEPEEPHRRQSP